MRRRIFLGYLAASVLAPIRADAQQPVRRRLVGVLGTATPAAWRLWIAAFERRLQELGWNDASVAIEYRWTGGHNERLPELAADLVRLKADVIVTTGTGVPALRKATPDTPIVFAIGRDPVRDGLVASLARPGGNVTGLSTQVTEVAGKRIQLLREVVPGVRRLAILSEVDDPAATRERGEAEAAARALGLEVAVHEIRRPDDELAPAFERLKGRADALYCGGGAITTLRREPIFALALAARLPAIGGLRIHAMAGSLMSYGPDYADLFRRAADYVDKILRGAKPGDLPVEQPTKFELIINNKTARGLGLRIPSKFLFTADEIIE